MTSQRNPSQGREPARDVLDAPLDYEEGARDIPEADLIVSPAHDALAEAPEEGPGLSRRSVEFFVGALLFVLAALVIWDNNRIGAGWERTGPQAGYFPMRVGIVTALCSLLVIWKAFRTDGSELFVMYSQLKRVLQVLVPLTIYVALIVPLGIYVASTIFIAAFMVVAGKYPVWKGVALAAATNLLMFYIFEIQFKVPLPKGPLEAWLGY